MITVFKNIFETTDPVFIDIVEIFKRIKDGHSKSIVEKIRYEKRYEKRSEIKKRLPSICFSGKFSKREAEFLLKHSGFICLDIDHIKEKDLSKIKKIISDDEYTYGCFVSPSGNGLKFIIKIAPEKSEHKSQFRALERYFNEKLKGFTSDQKNERKKPKSDEVIPIDPEQGEYLRVHVDKSGKDVNRVCYESYDPEIYFNEDSEEWYETLDESVEEKMQKIQNDETVISDPSRILELLGKWIEKRESYHQGNRNNYLSKLIYAMCRYGVDPVFAKDYIMKKFDGVPYKDVEAMVKSCYKKGDFNTQQFTERELKTGNFQYDKVDAKQSVTVFWDINEKGKVKIETIQLLKFIDSNGYKTYRPIKGINKIYFVHVENHVVEKVDVIDIRNCVLDFVEKNAPEPVFHEMQMKNRYFEPTFLHRLKMINVEQIRDKEKSSYFFFKNFYYEVTAKEMTKHTYIDLEGKHIWKEQMCKQEMTELVDYDKYSEHDFPLFVYRAMGENTKKYKSACAALGYGIHTFKKHRLAKLIYACDESMGELDDMAMGGTGKNLFFRSLDFCRSVASMDGKGFDKRDKFGFQTIEDDTQILNIDDYEGNIKELFTKITGNFEVEKKGMAKTVLEFEKSPKIFVSSNTSPIGFSSSYRRRLYVVEFSDHYNEKNTPEKEFGDRDFFGSNWGQNDYNCFYSFMMFCAQYYLKHGLKEMVVDSEKYLYKQVAKVSGRNFADHFLKMDIDKFQEGREIYEQYRSATNDDIHIAKFYSNMRKMCSICGWRFVTSNKGVNKKIKIEKNG